MLHVTAEDEASGAVVEAALGAMTLEEKIMQMAQVDKSYIHDMADLAKYGIGSLISGGSGQPFDNSPLGFAEMVDEFQRHSLQSRLGIPLVYAGDAVHGMSLCRGTTIFPHNVGLGATGDEQLVHEIARATAVETACTGVAWAFSPCLAVVDDVRWGRTYESFGGDPEVVSRLGAAHITGLQEVTEQEKAALGVADDRGLTVAACAKHYVGDGGVKYGTGRGPAEVKLLDRGDVQMDEQAFRDRHLRPYVDAVRAGVKTVMVSFSSLNGEQMHAHARMIREVLKDELGFKGLVVSDWGGHSALEGPGLDAVDKVSMCVNAGVDMIMVPEDYKAFLKDMLCAVERGLLSVSRIDEAVRAILQLKADLRLFTRPFADRTLLPSVRCPAHLALARRAVHRSAVYLRNNANALPLSKSLTSVFVCGRGADDLGLQCGGWTASWQGARGPITAGTTILEGLRQTLSPACEVTHSERGSGLHPQRHELALCVLAEDPYAEWFGDREDLALPPSEAQVLERVVGRGVPVVVVLLAGRALTWDWTGVDGVVLAWLPGSEGQGVVDALLEGPSTKA